MSDEPLDVVVVGAGMAGIAAATVMSAAGLRVVVVEKGAAVGGRMATRRIEGARFDHGAQHFSVRSPEFAARVDELVAAGIVKEWFQSASVTNPGRGVEVRHAGVAGMRGVVAHMAQGLDVRTSVAVDRLHHVRGRVVVGSGTGEMPARAVLLTPPVPQIKALLASSVIVVEGGLSDDLDAIRYDPCLAVMATLDRPSGVPEGHLALDSGPVAWIADNRQKGISAVPAVTIHGSAAFSTAHLESEPATWVEDLVASARGHLRSRVIAATGHRWRYARPRATIDLGYVVVDGPAPVVLAGEVFAGARVEGAFTSGMAAGAAVADLLG